MDGEPIKSLIRSLARQDREPVREDRLRIQSAKRRMKEWADQHGEADTQGLIEDEWDGLAMAALGIAGWDKVEDDA